jgi:hypothetical protein
MAVQQLTATNNPVGVEAADIAVEGIDVRWPVRFALKNPAAAAGWIVQKVSIRYRTWAGGGVFTLDKITLDDGTLKDMPAMTYWEAWPVAQGAKIPAMPGGQDGRTPSVMIPTYPDEYMVKAKDDEQASRGEMRVLGELGFFAGELPPDFVLYNPATFAAKLPSTVAQPASWPPPVPMNHHMVVTWDTLTATAQKGIKRLQTAPEAPNQTSPKSNPWAAW